MRVAGHGDSSPEAVGLLAEVSAMALRNLLAVSWLLVDRFVSRVDFIELHASSRKPTSRCPLCSAPSSRIQSRYTRTLADLPWQGISVRLLLGVRRFFCETDDCPRRIFTE